MIPPLADISGNLPYDGKRLLLVSDADQDTNQIIKHILLRHGQDKKAYDDIAEKFWRGNAKETAQLLFDFLKTYVNYQIEPESSQTVKSPGNILANLHGDCKHYALFITGIADALKRKGYPIDTFYRFVADQPNMDVHHVFSVIKDADGNEFWVDPVLKEFNKRPQFFNVVDKRPEAAGGGVGAVYALSGTWKYPVAQVGRSNIFKRFVHSMEVNFANLKKGVEHTANEAKEVVKKQIHAAEVNATNAKNAVVKVSGVAARKAFLALVALNFHGFATALDQARKDPAKTEELRNKWVKKLQGDWGTLMATIDRGLKKKAILGLNGLSGQIGLEPTSTAALITLATAVIALMGSLLKVDKQTQATLNNAATTGAANMLANSYSAAAAQNVLNDPNSTDAQIKAAAAALNQLAAQGQNGLNMSVNPGVNADGSPNLTVDDLGGNVPGTGLNQLVNNAKQFYQNNKMLVIGLGVGAGLLIANSGKKRTRRR